MMHCRMLAEYAAGVRKSARSVNPYQASTGQEASAAGWVSDLEPSDTIALGELDAAPAVVKGAPLEDLIAPLYAGRSGGEDHILGFTSIEEQGAAIIEAGFAAKRKKKRPVVVAFASATTATQDPWQEMVSKATRKKLPIVFVVENNPWPAATKPSSPAETVDLAAIARANAISCIPVDGNDVVAVYRVAFESLDRLRQGDGPFLVEARTYSDAGRGKRSVERDPLVHMERYLKAKKLFSAEWKDQVVDDFSKKLKQAAKAARQRNK